MADQFINVRVNAEQAKKNLESVTDKVIDQEAQIAQLSIALVKAEQDLANFNFKGYKGQLQLEGQVNKTKQQIELLKKQLAQLKVEQKAESRVLRNANKVRTAGTIKAAEFNETLLKNRDITSGLSKATGGLSLQFQSFGKLFISLGRGIKLATASLSLFQKVLISTGIGALVVAIGTLAANWDKVKSALGGVSKEQKKQVEDAKELVTTQEQQYKNLTDTEEILKRQGKTEREITNLKIQQTNETIAALEAQLTAQKTIRKQQIETANRNRIILTGILNFLLRPIKKIAESIDKIGKRFGKDFGLADKVGGAGASIAGSIFTGIDEEGDNAIKETEQKLRQLRNKRAGFLNKIDEDDKKAQDKANKEIADNIAKSIADESKRQQAIKNIRDKFTKLNQDADDLNFQQKAERERERALAELTALNATEEQKAELIKYYQGVITNAITQDEQVRANKIKEVEEQKRAIREKTFNTAIQLAGEESRLGKAMLVAKTILAARENIMEVKKTLIKAQQASTEATVDGAKAGSAIAAGSAETLKAGFPQNIPLIIAYIAQAIGVISAVKSAVGKTKSVAASAGAGGGSMPMIQAPSIQSAAPSFNIVGADSSNQLAQTISAQTNKPIQTYVVAGDVTTAQGLERNIIQESSLG